MGGNTKILIEAIKHLSKDFNIVVFTTEPVTLEVHLAGNFKYQIEEIPYPFRKLSFKSHLRELHHLNCWYSKYFKLHTLSKSDVFYSASDFAPDVLPIYVLKRRHDFNWVASLYLFIPNPWENLRFRFGFPTLKYLVYYFYQRLLFMAIMRKANSVVVTNERDFPRFGNRHPPKLFAIYGGVNLEEIDAAKDRVQKVQDKHRFDVIFCSRLHEQKGIDGLLDIWCLVMKELPLAKLGIIGTGAEQYETYLKNKAAQILPQANLEWLGYVNGIDKYVIYLQSKVFAHPTIYDNNGMVAAEALCAGMPVVMYDLPNFQDLYVDGCIKVPRLSKTDFAKALVLLLSDSKSTDALKLSPSRLERLRFQWSWENRMEQLSEFFKSE
jgi:glycosyltransferase involved in cell wall biosynthesis